MNIDNTPGSLTLYKAQIDWLTVTSWENLYWETMKSIKAGLMGASIGGKIIDGAKRLQYLGQVVQTTQGSVFIGQGRQKRREHYMMQSSGEVCNLDTILTPTLSGVRQGWQHVRRIDLQITIPEPENWSQWRFFNRNKKRGRSVGWAESRDRDGNLSQTVYIGKRTSDKYLRLYEKIEGGERYIRCEYELKGLKAESVARWIAEGRDTVSSLMVLFMDQTDDDQMTAMYAQALDGVKPADKPDMIKREPKTKKWLMETVYSCFESYILDHDADGEVREAFRNAIERADRWD